MSLPPAGDDDRKHYFSSTEIAAGKVFLVLPYFFGTICQIYNDGTDI